MFSSTPGNLSLAANPPATGFGATTGVINTGFGNPSTLGTAGTLFSSTSLANPQAATSGFKTGFSFGQPTTTTATSNLFGGVGASTTAASGFGTSFGFQTKPATGFAFGASTTSTAPTTTTTTASAFPTLGGFGTNQSSFGSSLFGGSNTAAVAPTAFSFASSTAQQPALSAPAPSSFGLGGVSAVPSSTSADKSDSKTLKEYPVPPEISTLVESFKSHIKAQKELKDEFSSKSLTKVVDEIENLKQLLSVISNGLHRNVSIVKNLKLETVQELKNAEILQRTKDIPFPLQYENTAPMEYFARIVMDFEQKMKMYRQQIDGLVQHLPHIGGSSALTPQDLLETIRKLHEAFVCIAAKVQNIQENIEMQKERLLSQGQDIGNGNQAAASSVISFSSALPVVTVGPSPFSTSHSTLASAFATAYERAQQITGAVPSVSLASAYPSLSGYGNTSYLQNRSLATTPSFSFGKLASTSTSTGASLVGSSAGSASLPTTPNLGVANQASFQLQKPPIGNKRGKR